MISPTNPCMFRGRCRAFTLVELLLVVTIIAVATAISLPRFSVAMSGGRLRVALRTLAQTGRYARTMAILNQVPVDLIVEWSEEEIVVRVEPHIPLERLPMPGPAIAEPAHADAMDGSPDVPEGIDAIAVRHALSGVSIRFLGFRDAPPGEPDGAADRGSLRIRYTVAGNCRPHAFQVMDPGGVAYELHVDRIGTPEVVERSR